MSSANYLVKLGLSRNEAKALDALIALGPVGASDVHRYAGIPRNKAYESLEALVKRGMIEVQHGRPTLYRAIHASVIVGNLLEEYQHDAKEVLTVLEQNERNQRELGDGDASVWMVRGEEGIKRRLAELIYEAKRDVFSISGYPPKYVLSVRTALRSAAARGVNVRPVCMIPPALGLDGLTLEGSGSPIEYRTVKALATLRSKPIDIYDERLIEGFSHMHGSGAMVVIDESMAYNIVDDGTNPARAAGIIMKTPGIPKIQKATVERVLGLFTRKV